MLPEVETVTSDVLILGGGMAGCGAAFEAAYWARASDLRVVLVEKSAIERSGAAAAGLSAINCFLGSRWGWNQPEDFVRYVRNDTMGLCREDLVYDIARHVDSSVHLFESWGLPFYKTPDGRYQREGRWQVLIHGESYKPIVAEAARNAIGNGKFFERVYVSHLLTDRNDPSRIAGAVGFSLRQPKLYVFRANAVIVAAGGATGLFRSHAAGEGRGRIWYAPWNTGSAYALMIRAGAEMAQMEHRLVVPRFKDGYGPVGMWFLLYKAALKNAFGESVEKKWADLIESWAPYNSASPVPTPLRVYQMACDADAGGRPHLLATGEAMQQALDPMRSDPSAAAKIENQVWENCLAMTPSQALAWASESKDPASNSFEIALTEPYLIGSHASAAGAWVSGPPDLAPGDCFWGYNRMTTIRGLFAAGDGAGACAHKFSSGSFTEGRLAGKAAVTYATDHPEPAMICPDRLAVAKSELLRPLAAAAGKQSLPAKQGLLRLQKIMDEYGAGMGANYATNELMLRRGLELLELLHQDLQALSAHDAHELMRCRELEDRLWCATAHLHHLLHRRETRWPGYYRRTDFPTLDEQNWHCFGISRCDPTERRWSLRIAPVHRIVP